VTKILIHGQARCQDLAAGGAQKAGRRGQKPEGWAKNQKDGPKTRKGGHILKILHWMYTATRRPNVKLGAGHHWTPAGDGPVHGPCLHGLYLFPTRRFPTPAIWPSVTVARHVTREGERRRTPSQM